jgi:serine protease Do
MKKLFGILVLIAVAVYGCNTNGNSIKSNSLRSQPFDFTDAAKLVTPTVVHINTYSPQAREGFRLFEELFRDRRGREGGEDEDDGMQLTGSGSGVIFSADGHIVTSLHIIEEAERIDVTLNDRRVYRAEVIGKDPATDLAVIKIEAKNLSAIEFGDAEQLQVGEWIAAVGNPFNLTSTVTAGIVSAKGRDLNLRQMTEGLLIESFIQTDAAVNPGNSGGALVNIRGELVGINAAIASPTGVFAGYSFAVPAYLVRKVIDDVLEFGEVRRGILGVSIRNIDPVLAEEKSLNDLDGAYVESVIEGSAAAQAGIQQGDVIISVEGSDVASAGQLQEAVSLKRPGEEIKITYRRKGRIQKAEMILGNRPS